MAPGTQARLVCEWPEMSLGEVVTVIRFDAAQGYLARTNAHLEETWLPAHVLTNYNRKPWSFRFKKPSRRSLDGAAVQDGAIAEAPLPLEFRDKLKDVTVQAGSKVALKCRVKNCTKGVRVTWKKTEPNACVMQNGRFLLGSNEGVATLHLDNAKPSDSGTYAVTITNDYSSIESCAVLTVTDTNPYPPLHEPKIQVLSSSSVLLEWESNAYSQFLVEFCKLGSGEWSSPSNPLTNNQSYTFENLTPGETYSFRIVAAQNKLVSLPSVAVTLPIADNLRWQQEQFKRRYVELEEIDRGRFSVVRLAKDRGTGVEVALKQVTRRKQPHNVTKAEYALLAGMQHLNIVRSMALFDNAPLPGLDTIVLELVKGPLLFVHISSDEEYSEADVRNYTRQLMSALNWLHKKDIAHLDIKPENVMVDVSNSSAPVLKLVDFGDSVNTLKNVILPPACLEFASPELVLGQPVGKHTDFWAAGVFLYVLLSGVSPFLDDSMEETTANILKCDFCFPEDYFSEISGEAKELVVALLVLVPSSRMDMESCLKSSWMKGGSPKNHNIPSSRLRTFMQRRHPINVATSPTSPTYFN